jgi:integrase
MGNLTVKQIENAKPKIKPYKLMDGDGLQLRIAVDGIKTWLVRYMFNGKERQYRLPEIYGDGEERIGLKQAREEATQIRGLARKGIDIQIKLENERQAEINQKELEAKKSKTLADLFEVWVKTVERKDDGKELRRSFAKDVFPVAGNIKLSEVSDEHIEKMLRDVVERGSNRISVTLFADLKQMFRWAAKKKTWKTLFDDPTEEIEFRKILPKDYKGAERTRSLSEQEIKELAEKLPKSGLLPRTQIAMWLMLSCCCRIGEVIQARWEHIDFISGIWIIPKENAKNKKEHTIFLSTVALKKFQELRLITENPKWCFPDTTGTTNVCMKSTTKQVRDRQMAAIGKAPMSNRTKNSDALLLINGDWVPHDLRRTGSTIMQKLKIQPAVIEKVLNHVEPSKLKRTYQTYDYADEKRDAWNRLGIRLIELVPELA